MQHPGKPGRSRGRGKSWNAWSPTARGKRKGSRRWHDRIDRQIHIISGPAVCRNVDLVLGSSCGGRVGKGPAQVKVGIVAVSVAVGRGGSQGWQRDQTFSSLLVRLEGRNSLQKMHVILSQSGKLKPLDTPPGPLSFDLGISTLFLSTFSPPPLSSYFQRSFPTFSPFTTPLYYSAYYPLSYPPHFASLRVYALILPIFCLSFAAFLPTLSAPSCLLYFLPSFLHCSGIIGESSPPAFNLPRTTTESVTESHPQKKLFKILARGVLPSPCKQYTLVHW